MLEIYCNWIIADAGKKRIKKNQIRIRKDRKDLKDRTETKWFMHCFLQCCSAHAENRNSSVSVFNTFLSPYSLIHDKQIKLSILSKSNSQRLPAILQ